VGGGEGGNICLKVFLLVLHSFMQINCISIFFFFFFLLVNEIDRHCGLVVRVPDYRSRGSGFDSRNYQIF
jgi:hypothetical protein